MSRSDHRPPGAFRSRLDAVRPRDEAGRRWLYVPYDQLSDRIGPLATEEPDALGLVFVECPDALRRRPFHRQRIAFLLANQRHFAVEQAERGVAVRYVTDAPSYDAALRPLADELSGLVCMRPAEREHRHDLAALVRDGWLRFVPHEGWLTDEDQFYRGAGSAPPWRMDAFYRLVRTETGILMDGARPEGGKYSHDAHNRKPWNGTPAAPTPPRFVPGAITEEVGAWVASAFADHPGDLDLSTIPASEEDAERLWAWAKAECLEHFGPYEDAMSESSRGLFHTRISPLLNVHRILPRRAVIEASLLPAPLQSREGFVRQVLGWREFVHHVHEQTDGFRDVPGLDVPHDDRGARPSRLGARHPLPPAFWGTPSGLRCLDETVAGVLEEGWSHHITRLMVLSNVATLLDVDPRELTDWFWAMYLDAYDWVVEPNVLAMGTYALGDLMTTKPYVSGAAYVNRMSDHCKGCSFDPRRNCPLTSMYWAFLERHADPLADNARLRLAYASLRRRTEAQRRADRDTYEAVRRAMARGERLGPPGPRRGEQAA